MTETMPALLKFESFQELHETGCSHPSWESAMQAVVHGAIDQGEIEDLCFEAAELADAIQMADLGRDYWQLTLPIHISMLVAEALRDEPSENTREYFNRLGLVADLARAMGASV